MQPELPVRSSVAPLWRLGRAVWDVFFPRCCVDCAAAVPEGTFRHLCPDCARRLFIVAEPHCSTCGHPFFGEMEGTRLCPHCETLVPAFEEGKTAILVRGPGRALIHTLKYRHGLHVLEDVTTAMRATPGYADYLRGAVLVPVPLHPRKRRQRGYNQAELLAECAKQVVGEEIEVKCLLRRAIDTVSQTRFDREERRANLKNAFAMAPGAFITPGQRYILVDDVFTTGSTLNACAAVLRRAGAVKLDVVTFGHG
jgi:ComF family protein